MRRNERIVPTSAGDVSLSADGTEAANLIGGPSVGDDHDVEEGGGKVPVEKQVSADRAGGTPKPSVNEGDSFPSALQQIPVLTLRQGPAGPFQLSPEDLTNPVAGSGQPVVFDWQNKDADFGPFGGLRGILSALKTDPTSGLDMNNQEDIKTRQEFFGTNERKVQPPVTYWELIWEGLHDFTLLLLIAAAVVSMVLGIYMEGWGEGWFEGCAILVAVVIVLNVAAVNDLQKDKQFRDLDAKNAQRNVKVLRGGRVEEVMVDFLLVGDVVKMEAGDMTPADGIYLEGSNVEMDESTLTGESDVMKKSVKRPFMISGSTMSSGECTMVVIGVGEHSLQGLMMKQLDQEVQPTPLQLKLEVLATQISKLGFVVALICFIAMVVTHMVEWAQGNGTVSEDGQKEWAYSNFKDLLEYFIVAITVLVVAIPEGLPLAVTISLAYSVRKMQKDQILVRHLEACETMGGATTICTDKTGTLTQNKMTVVQAWIEDNDETQNPNGIFLNEDHGGSQEGYDAFLSRLKNLPSSFTDLLLENCCLNSLADLVVDTKTELERVSGNKTEGALIILAKQCGMDYATKRSSSNVDERFPFTSARKRSSVLVWKSVGGHDRIRLYVKGAAEMVLRLCTTVVDATGMVNALEGHFTMDGQGNVEGEGRKAEIGQNVINAMASNALRTIALAYRDFDPSVLENKAATVVYPDHDNKGSGPCPAVEAELTLVGIVGIQDPVRPEVPAAVLSCQEAGITVRMVTGDNINTAIAIAKQCSIYNPEDQGIAVEGPEFREAVAQHGHIYFERTGPRIQVMARSAPQDKHLLVTNLMDRGQVVAVTGDGTNDGPALKKANVGFSMGMTGTEVAKQASDIVILDDNFTSIVKAVSWGRNVYDAIRKFLQFQLTVNIVALLIAFLGSVVLSESPLKATQMLWVNLIMDSLAALALATELPTPELLTQRPYGKTDSLISRYMLRNMLGQFFYQSIVIITITLYGEWFFEIEIGRRLSSTSNPTQHYTLVFHVFVMLQVFNEISSRKLQNEWNVFKGISKNPLFIGIVIGTVIVQIVLVTRAGKFASVTELTVSQHIISIIFGLGGMVVTMLMKFIPETHFPALSGSRDEMSEQQRQIWSAFTRRNSNPFVLSSKGKVGSSRLGAMRGPRKSTSLNGGQCLLAAIEENISAINQADQQEEKKTDVV